MVNHRHPKATLIGYCFFILLGSSSCSVKQVKSDGQQAGLVPVNIKRIARVTGKTLSGEHLPNPNRTDERYDVVGTDLGIAWTMGNGQVGMFFGDTYGKDWIPVKEGGPGVAGNWRSNVIGFSADKNLLDGLTFSKMVNREVLPSPHIIDGSGSHTAIPTAAIHLNGTDYVHFMDVKKWGSPGNWSTNYSGLYRSEDQGNHWLKCPEVNFEANSRFAQVAYAKKSGYVYMAGTISGRWGAIHLARFKEGHILKKHLYEYWNKTEGWVKNDEQSADPIIKAPAGELSLAYYSKYKRWIITYLNENTHQLVLRTAKNLTGAWTEEQTLATAEAYPGLYGAFIYPGYEHTNQLFFLMSMWHPYNVYLMHAELK